MKTLFFLLTLFISLHALTINESLLKIHATLIPKIYLMDAKCKEKIRNNTITIAIVYEHDQYKSARLLQKLILKKYKRGLSSYKIKAELVNYNKTEDEKANLFYLFPSSKNNILHVVQRAKENHALTFAYMKKDLKYGIMISLDISKKTKPLLNLQAVQQNNISLRAMLIDISSIYNNHRNIVPNSFNQKQNVNFICLASIHES